MVLKDKYVYFELLFIFVKVIVDLLCLYWFFFCFWCIFCLFRLCCVGYIMNESMENVIFFFVF